MGWWIQRWHTRHCLLGLMGRSECGFIIIIIIISSSSRITSCVVSQSGPQKCPNFCFSRPLCRFLISNQKYLILLSVCERGASTWVAAVWPPGPETPVSSGRPLKLPDSPTSVPGQKSALTVTVSEYGLVHTQVSIFYVDFSMRFGLSSTHKWVSRSLKMELLENWFQGETVCTAYQGFLACLFGFMSSFVRRLCFCDHLS